MKHFAQVNRSSPVGEVPRLSVVTDQQRQSVERPRILVVDGSPLMRRLTTRILESEARWEVVGSTRTVQDALSRINFYRPDLVTLEAEVSEEHKGVIDALREGCSDLRLVVRGELDERCARLTMEALFASADSAQGFSGMLSPVAPVGAHFIEDLVRRVSRAMSQAEPRLTTPTLLPGKDAVSTKDRAARYSIPSASPSPVTSPFASSYPQVLAIGSSTGGPAALSAMMSALPASFPVPVLIVQHMPPHFTRLLAERLSKNCRLPVVEGEHGMEVTAGKAYIAPGDFHMVAVRRGNKVELQLTKADPENSCRPAVDVLFRSVAETYHRSAIAVVLTGMGQDGLKGVRTLKEMGVPVLVQDRQTSVVWGMPGAIADAGLADSILPITEIVPAIMRLL